MPSVNIYLSEDLFEYIKKNKSKIVKEALKEHKEKHRQQKKHQASHPLATSTPHPT